MTALTTAADALWPLAAVWAAWGALCAAAHLTIRPDSPGGTS